jgi:hypothetical protein
MNALIAVSALSGVDASVTADRLGGLMGPVASGTLFLVGYLQSRAAGRPPSDEAAVVAQHAVLVSRARERVLVVVSIASLVGATLIALR